MFDVLAEQTDTVVNSTDYQAETETTFARANSEQPTFRAINVLMIGTKGDAANTSIIEQCLRYMVGFECQIAQAGSAAAATFALQADRFDLVVTDEHSLDLIEDHAAVPTIVIAGHPSSETTLKALVAGAVHCLPLIDLSPRLLETAINQALADEA